MKSFCILNFLFIANVFFGQFTFKLDTVNGIKSQYVDDRPLYVLVPQIEVNQPLKVIYMHDGQMLFDSTTTWNHQEWGVDESMAIRVNKYNKDPYLVVGIPNNGVKRKSEYFPERVFHALSDSIQSLLLESEWQGESRSDEYLKYIVFEVIPYIERHYSVSKKAQDRFLCGSSSGGNATLYAFCEYPDVFPNAVCFSTHWPGSTKHQDPEISELWLDYLKAKLPSSKGRTIYMDRGTEGLDHLYGIWQEQVDFLIRKKGYKKNFTSLVFSGHDHVEKAWKERFSSWLLRL